MTTRPERYRAIDAAVAAVPRPGFETLRDEHWGRFLRWARSPEGRRNRVREQIAGASASSKNFEPGFWEI